MAARASSSDDRPQEKAECDKPLDTWTEGDVQCFVNSNFSVEIAKKFKGKVSFVSTAVASMLFIPEIDFLPFTNVSYFFINR